MNERTDLEKGKIVADRCIRLIKPYVPNSSTSSSCHSTPVKNNPKNDAMLEELVGEGNVLLDIPLENQVYRLICMTGSNGITRSVSRCVRVL